jgi:hypothetical protein
MTTTQYLEKLIDLYCSTINRMIKRSAKFYPLWAITGLMVASYVSLVLAEAMRRKALDIEL